MRRHSLEARLSCLANGRQFTHQSCTNFIWTLPNTIPFPRHFVRLPLLCLFAFSSSSIGCKFGEQGKQNKGRWFKMDRMVDEERGHRELLLISTIFSLPCFTLGIVHSPTPALHCLSQSKLIGNSTDDNRRHEYLTMNNESRGEGLEDNRPFLFPLLRPEYLDYAKHPTQSSAYCLSLISIASHHVFTHASQE